MKQEFFIPGTLPGLNEIIDAARTHYQRYADMKRDFTGLVCAYIRQAKLAPMIRASVHFTWSTNSMNRDPDNISAGEKFILDGLVVTRILPNDGLQQVLSLHHEFCLLHRGIGVLVVLDGLAAGATATATKEGAYGNGRTFKIRTRAKGKKVQHPGGAGDPHARQGATRVHKRA